MDEADILPLTVAMFIAWFMFFGIFYIDGHISLKTNVVASIAMSILTYLVLKPSMLRMNYDFVLTKEFMAIFIAYTILHIILNTYLFYQALKGG